MLLLYNVNKCNRPSRWALSLLRRKEVIDLPNALNYPFFARSSGSKGFCVRGALSAARPRCSVKARASRMVSSPTPALALCSEQACSGRRHM